MAYEGEAASSCQVGAFGDGWLEVVVVTGTGPNFCGHALAHCRATKQYFHVAGRKEYPKVIPDSQFERFLKENGKIEIRRTAYRIPYPSVANAKLCELLADRWRWFVLPHNCAAFVEEIIQAGGLSARGLWANCPIWENF